MTELIVACTLLASIMGVVVPTFVRLGQLNRGLQHRRVAMNEIGNQLESLHTLPVDQLQKRISELKPSDIAERVLPNAKLSGDLQSMEDGIRVAIEIHWDDRWRQNRSLRLCTWVYPESQP